MIVPPGYRQVWLADFTKLTALPANLSHAWGAPDDYWFSGQSNGLVIASRASEKWAATGFMQAPTGASAGQGYGLYAATFSTTSGQGGGINIVMWPATNVWPGPEVDLIEITDPTQQTGFATVHWKGADGSNQYHTFSLKTDFTKRHTVAWDWQPDALTLYLDGLQQAVYTQNVPKDFADGGQNLCFGAQVTAAGSFQQNLPAVWLSIYDMSFWAKDDPPVATLLFSDDFTTLNWSDSGSSTQWQGQLPFGWGKWLNGTQEEEYYTNTTENGGTWNPFSVANSILTISADTESHSGYTNPSNQPYNSGCITSCATVNSALGLGLFQHQYGYFEAKMLLPKGQGFWPAFWLFNNTSTGKGIEIDIIENGGGDTTKIYQSVHAPSMSGQTQTKTATVSDASINWHTYGVDWQSDFITFYIDRVQTNQFPTPTEGTQDTCFMLLNLAIGSGTAFGQNGSGPFGPPNSSTPFPSGLQIDYVKVWDKFPGVQTTGGSGMTDFLLQGVKIGGSQLNDVNVYNGAMGGPCQLGNIFTDGPGIGSDLSATGTVVNGGLSGHGVRLLWSAPLCNSGSDLPNAAAGKYNAQYTQAAKDVLAYSPNTPVIYVRIGWEFNFQGWGWSPNNSGNGGPSNYIKAWRNCAQAFKAVSNKFRMVWCYNCGNTDPDPATCWPGDDVVDVVSVDAYQGHSTAGTNFINALNNNNRGVAWGYNFAQCLNGVNQNLPSPSHAHTTPLPFAFPEWGVGGNSDSDSVCSTYIQDMWNWCHGKAASNGTDFPAISDPRNVAFQAYWNDNSGYTGKISDNHLPNTLTTYKHTFGAESGVAAGSGPTLKIPLIIKAKHQAPAETFTDADNKVWSISLTSKMVVGGSVDTSTSSVVQAVWDGVKVWHMNTAGNWYWKNHATDSAWIAAGTSGPLVAGQADRVYDFVKRFMGVNTLSNWNPQSPNAQTHLNALAYLGVGLVRALAGSSDNNGTKAALAQAGYKFTFLGQDQGNASSVIAGNLSAQVSATGVSSFAFVEGPNEPGPGGSWNLSASQVQSYSQAEGSALSGNSALTAAGVPGMSFSPLVQTLSTTESFVSSVGGLVGDNITRWNWHGYNNTNGFAIQPSASANGPNESLKEGMILAPGCPGCITEWGVTPVGQSYEQSSPAAGAKIALNHYCSHYTAGARQRAAGTAASDVAGSFIFSLFNETGEGFGLLNNDATVRQQAATAIHNFTTILADNVGAASAFNPGALDFTVSNLPSGAYYFVLGKSDGSFWIVLVDERAVQDGSGNDTPPTAQVATVKFNSSVSKGAVYDPIKGTSAQSSFGAVPSVNVSLAGYPMIVQAVPSGGSNVVAPFDTLQRNVDGTGANTGEGVLTTSTVSSTSMKQAYTPPTFTDRTFAQALYVSCVNVGGSVRNVVIVGDVSNNVYCHDADSGARLWGGNPIALGTPVNNSFGVSGYGDFYGGNIGIVATPAYDKVNDRLYVVANHYDGTNYTLKLHTISVLNGTVKSTVTITASDQGKTMNPQQQISRPGVVINPNNGNVYISLGSHGDNTPYQGWLIAYAGGDTPAQKWAYCTNTSTNGGGSLWMSGGPPIVSKDDGAIYFGVGNGVGGDATQAAQREQGVVKLTDNGSSYTLTSWWTESSWSADDGNDTDVAQANILLIPGTNVVLVNKKDGTVYVLDRTNLGSAVGSASSTFNVGSGAHSMVWDAATSSVFVGANGQQLQKWTYSGGALGTFSKAATTNLSGLGPASASGTADMALQLSPGIIWAIWIFSGDANQGLSGVQSKLICFKTADFTELFSSGRDLNIQATPMKWNPPTIGGAKVFWLTGDKTMQVFWTGAAAPACSVAQQNPSITGFTATPGTSNLVLAGTLNNGPAGLEWALDGGVKSTLTTSQATGSFSFNEALPAAGTHDATIDVIGVSGTSVSSSFTVPGAGGGTPSTWNTTNTNMTLSTDHLTATVATAAYALVKGTSGKSATDGGTYQFEFTMTTVPAGQLMVPGLANASFGSGADLGTDTNGIGFYPSTGHMKYNNTTVQTGPTFAAAGDVITVKVTLNGTGSTAQYKVNGGTPSPSMAWTAASGATYYPCFEDGGDATDAVAFNGGASGSGLKYPFTGVSTWDPVAQAPGAPTSLAVSSTTTTSITVGWTNPTTGGAVSSININYRKNSAGSTGPWTSFATGLSPTTTSETVTGLDYEGWDIQVVEVGAGGSTAAMLTNVFPTAPANPGAVTSLALVAGSATTGGFTVSWVNPTTGGPVNSLSAQHRAHGSQGAWTVDANASLAATATSYAFTGLAPTAPGGAGYDIQIITNGATGTTPGVTELDSVATLASAYQNVNQALADLNLDGTPTVNETNAKGLLNTALGQIPQP